MGPRFAMLILIFISGDNCGHGSGRYRTYTPYYLFSLVTVIVCYLLCMLSVSVVASFVSSTVCTCLRSARSDGQIPLRCGKAASQCQGYKQASTLFRVTLHSLSAGFKRNSRYKGIHVYSKK
jgi:hypothetical protein